MKLYYFGKLFVIIYLIDSIIMLDIILRIHGLFRNLNIILSFTNNFSG